jgi:hypothetical protein
MVKVEKKDKQRSTKHTHKNKKLHDKLILFRINNNSFDGNATIYIHTSKIPDYESERLGRTITCTCTYSTAVLRMNVQNFCYCMSFDLR